MRKRLSILGSGISGVGAAILAKDKGYEVFVSDSNEITSNVKNKLDFISIPWEENKHSYAELKKSDLVIKSPGISNESEIIVKLKNSNGPDAPSSIDTEEFSKMIKSIRLIENSKLN